MAIGVKDNTSYAVEIETTEGTYVAPQAADSYVQILKDGAEMTRTQELLSREVFTGSIGKTQSRLGTRSASGALPVEFRAGETEGAAPEADKLYTSALGSKKQTTTITTETGHTTTQINIGDADISSLSQYDIVMVKEAGAFALSWVSAVDTTPGSANITLGAALDAAPADNVELAAMTQYCTADSGHPSLSVTKYIEDSKREIAVGSKVTSLSLDNFQTGAIPSVNFGFESLSFDSSLTASPFTPDYDGTLPPIALRACVLQDGQEINVNSLAVSLTNTLGFVTATCSDNGRISSRVTAREITGSFTPYKSDDELAQFEKFKCNTPYTLFAYAFNPVLDANCDFTGEFTNATAVLLTNVITTELGESDSDGLLVEDVTFEATRGADGADEEMKIAFF